MQKRRLGGIGLEVSVLGLGCMGMSGGYSERPDRDAMITLLRQAVELGVTFFDTAEIYGMGHNEALVGEALAPVRDKVVIASKFFEKINHEVPELEGRRVRPDEVAGCLEGTLRRLGTDWLDLYYLHRVNPEVPIEEYAGVLGELADEGKIRGYGLSEAAAETIRRADAVHPVTAVQSEYSLWWKRPEEEVLGVCEELGIGFVPFSPLGKGFLTGTVDTSTSFEQGNDIRTTIPRFAPEALEKNMAMAELVRDVAENHGAAPSQIALAWLLSRRPWIVPIPGTRRLERLKENLGAATLELSDEDMDALTEAAAQIPIEGGRYDEHHESMTNL